MHLAFSAEIDAIREEFRTVLASSNARSALQQIERGHERDLELWDRLAQTGWLAAGVGESFGGSELGELALCVLAEECGRALAAIPFGVSSCGFASALSLCDASEAQARWLSRIADGSAIGMLLMPQDWQQAPSLSAAATQLSGETQLLLDAASANAAITLVGDKDDARLLLVELCAAARAGDVETTLDLLHPAGSFKLTNAPATSLASGTQAHALWQRMLDRLAIFTAFEQLGGAQAALEMARDYSLTRYAFGRAIGSFQALKHSMADMLSTLELARSNCYYAAAALASDDSRVAEAAAVARISASEAFRLCAKQCLQIHGGIGVTWESDAHLYYRRAQSLASSPGSQTFWKERLVSLLVSQHASAT
jgi:acyl-CoA dehydrogenase